MKNKTDYQISALMNEGIIEIVITGELTSADVKTLHAEVISTIMGQKVRAVLCDIRDLKGPDEFGEAYFRSRDIPAYIVKLPLAVVEQSDNEAYQSFYETTASNAGLSLRWFTDVDAARSWLKSKL